MAQEPNLLDYLYVLLKWRRLVLASVLGVSLAAAGVSLVLPQEWTATTRLLPPEEEPDQFGLSMLVTAAVPPNLSRLVGGGATPSERLVTILGSKRVLGAVVDRFGLLAEYDLPSRDQAIELLDQRVERELGRDGTLTIAVTAGSPSQAAALANGVAEELDAVNRSGRQFQAGALRRFLEERRVAVQAEMVSQAAEFRRFQETYGLVDLEAQTRAAVEVVRGTVQELTLLEVKLQVARQELAPGHEELKRLEWEVEAARGQLAKLTGEAVVRTETPGAVSSLGPALRDLPGLGQAYGRLALELRIKEQLLAYLGTKIEEAKYSEARNTPTVQVLDPATPPETRSAPRRTLIVLVAAAVSLMTSVVLAFVLESASRLGEVNREQLERIRSLFSGGR
ncbi:MAG: Wzz/FepE/Etk N-terminal domain-containing protein [Candidatus Latescibacterota bacterium]|jgi:uncharacterized protein involved in exopolysaccharide biosynthesis